MALDWQLVPGGLTIEQVTGPKHVLHLEGRGMPFRPLKLGGEQRMNVRWSPGSPDATVQVLGSKESSTTIRGRWSRRYIGTGGGPSAQIDGVEVEDVEQLADFVEGMRIDGQLVKFSTGTRVRFGVIAMFEPSWNDPHDCEWELAFNWISRTADALGAQPLQVVAQQGVSGLAARAAVFVNAVDDILAVAPFAPASAWLDKASQLLAKIATAYGSLQDAATSVVSIATAPAQLATRVVALASSMSAGSLELGRFLCADVATQYKRPVSQAAALGQVLGRIPDPTIAAERAAQDAWRADAAILARSMARSAARSQLQAMQFAAPGTLAIYRALQGDDLRTVSVKFYGTQAQWRALREYNDLQSSALEPGTRVIVPELSVLLQFTGATV
jgi:hypothetical protein